MWRGRWESDPLRVDLESTALPLRYTPILKKGATINMTPFNGGRNPPQQNAPNSVGAHPLRWRFLTNRFLNANHMYHSPY